MAADGHSHCPMSLGDLLDTAFAFYRTHFGILIGVTALVWWPLLLLHFIIFYTIEAPLGQMLGILLLDMLALILIGGALTNAIDYLVHDQPTTSVQAYQIPLRDYRSLLLAGFIRLIFFLIPIGVTIAIIWYAYTAPELNVYMQNADTEGEQIGFTFFMLFLLLYPPFAISMAALFLVTPPVIVREHTGPLAGLRRSWHFTMRHFWDVVGAVVMLLVVYGIGQLPLMVVHQSGIASRVAHTPLAMPLLTLILLHVGLMLGLPYQAIISTLLYMEFCNRNEGHDLLVLADTARDEAAQQARVADAATRPQDRAHFES